MTLRAGGSLVIVTQGDTPYDDQAEVKLSGDVVEELDAVLAALGREMPAADPAPGSGAAIRSAD